jgi:DHA3 family multidrug efflux protein-like MFS transporter
LLGTGEARGIALIFLIAGLVTVILGLGALALPQYRAISRQYAQAGSSPDA